MDEVLFRGLPNMLYKQGYIRDWEGPPLPYKWKLGSPRQFRNPVGGFSIEKYLLSKNILGEIYNAFM